MRLRPCRYCGFTYKGRGLYADHGFSEYNLERHEEVCLEQRAERAVKASRARGRAFRARVRAGGPGEGQLGLFDEDEEPEDDDEV